jgi:protein disulfide-isomerase
MTKNAISTALRGLAVFSLLLTGFAARADELPYNQTADSRAEVRQALIEAHQTQKPVLVIFGANWCEDCRALDHSLKTGKNADLIAQEFEVVKIDVGRFNRNLDIARVYGDPIKKGIPAAVILSPSSEVLYSTRAGELSNARRMNDEGVYGFFKEAIAHAKSAN